MNSLRQRLASDRWQQRLFTALILFFFLFFAAMVIAYFLLPQGFLRNKNPLQSWQQSPAVWVRAAQIFFYNMLSVAVIALASLAANRKTKEQRFLPVSYQALFTLAVINGVVLGTWSFGAATAAGPPLLERFLGTFDLRHAGIWEMVGQVCITAALAGVSRWRWTGTTEEHRRFSELRLSPGEGLLGAAGLALMLIGAVVESFAMA